LRGARGDIKVNVGEDVVVYLDPKADGNYAITAGDDILLVLLTDANATLTMQGDEIAVEWPGVEPLEDVTERVLVLGDGSARINLSAGGDVRAGAVLLLLVSLIWGVGRAFQDQLARDGISRIGQLQAIDKIELMKRYGSMGARLYHLARGEDSRRVSPDDDTKSIGAETTFNSDISAHAELERILWRLSEKVSRRAKGAGLAGQTVILKLKTADFRTRTRNTMLAEPTLMANRIFEAAAPLLRRETVGMAFRLIGVSISHLTEAMAGTEAETLDARVAARSKAEIAMDQLRDKFGREAFCDAENVAIRDN